MRLKYIYTILFIPIFWGCKKEKSFETPLPSPFPIEFKYRVNDLQTTNEFTRDSSISRVLKQPLLDEASGLAYSRVNPNVLWSHNDSGHPNRLFAISTSGQSFGYFVVQGASSRDWEDIAAGPGPIEGQNYVFIADIGDNSAQHNFVVIYRVKEPQITNYDSAAISFIPNEDVERFEFTYPDGARDAETFMVDPISKDWFIVSKRDARSTLYRAKYPQVSGERVELEKLAYFPFTTAVAGDISIDGSLIAIKTNHRIYAWKREPGESVLEALSRTPSRLRYDGEPQGESIAWDLDLNGYYTLSEQGGFFPPDVHYYKRN